MYSFYSVQMLGYSLAASQQMPGGVINTALGSGFNLAPHASRFSPGNKQCNQIKGQSQIQLQFDTLIRMPRRGGGGDIDSIIRRIPQIPFGYQHDMWTMVAASAGEGAGV